MPKSPMVNRVGNIAFTTMKKKDLKALIGKLESLLDAEMGQLQGGFVSVGGENNLLDGVHNIRCPITNNCDGGNCVAGCGGK